MLRAACGSSILKQLQYLNCREDHVQFEENLCADLFSAVVLLFFFLSWNWTTIRFSYIEVRSLSISLIAIQQSNCSCAAANFFFYLEIFRCCISFMVVDNYICVIVIVICSVVYSFTIDSQNLQMLRYCQNKLLLFIVTNVIFFGWSFHLTK